MKHMIVNTHNAESCGFRSEQDGEAMGAALEGFGKAGAELGLTVDGFWIDRSAHAFSILVDAPNAHVIDEALLKSGLLSRSHSEIPPVLTMEEVRAAADAQTAP
jgi:hypothetical protein